MNLWKRYLSPTPKNVAKAMMAIKAVLMTIAGTEMAVGNAKLAFWIAVGTGVLNELSNFLTKQEEPKE